MTLAAPVTPAPRVSVVTPAYNAALYLRQAIDSILGQTFTDFEMIVIDDASTDATAAILASEEKAIELGLTTKARLVTFAFAGVEPEIMGYGPVPATHKALAKAGLQISDIGLIEINEAFAIQVLAFLDHFGIADDDLRVNPYGGAIAVGHPLASSGVRLMLNLARSFEEQHDVRYGITTMCIGLGMGGTVIWENPNWNGAK